jgi:hypothetical protein
MLEVVEGGEAGAEVVESELAAELCEPASEVTRDRYLHRVDTSTNRALRSLGPRQGGHPTRPSAGV